MKPTAVMFLLMINIPMYIGMGNLLFKSWKEFFDGLKTIYRNRKVFFYGWDQMGIPGQS